MNGASDSESLLAAEVRQVIARRTRATDDLASVSDDTWLGPEGVGLDSVGVVELLLECETTFGVRLPRVLLSGLPLTIGRLIRAIADVRAGRFTDELAP